MASISQRNSIYTNKQVHGRQIRLLEIVSTSPSIDCRLEVTSLLDDDTAIRAEIYHALSYVWGDSSNTEPILVNGSTISITTSLADALRRVPRIWGEIYPSRPPQECQLWADAVCIDQSSVDEKNYQVPLMKEIYTEAELVISWLGTGNATLFSAIDIINTVGPELERFDGDEEVSDDLSCKSIRSWIRGVKLVVDYGETKSLAEVSCDYFAAYLSFRRQLEIGQIPTNELFAAEELYLLRFSGIDHGWTGFPGLPSWAPNFAGNEVGEVISSTGVSSNGDRRGLFPEVSADLHLVDLKLTVQGIVADCVTSYATDETPPTWIQAVDVLEALRIRYGLRQAGLHSLSDEEFGGRVTASIRDQLQHEFLVGVRLNDIWKLEMQIADIASRGNPQVLVDEFLGNMDNELRVTALPVVLALHDDDSRCLGQLRLQMQLKSMPFRLAETAGGDLCLVPPGATEEDLICFLKGTSQPSLFRKSENYCLHVGTCSVLGLEEKVRHAMEIASLNIEPMEIR
ncbi:putative Heterokaryon incompatibility domain-containing protein [Seiridium unicorne]|uniref:Heterokaryon incompatibility domain-containing protein n=1 Tax=Seiridium unicorne TaxID=138068 RepID=A0ABR2UR38_9PEZI